MGRQKDLRERVLGPSNLGDGRTLPWQIIHVLADDAGRAAHYFKTQSEAQQRKEELEGALISVIRTTETARAAFVEDRRKDNASERTIEGYEWAFKKFWPTEVPLNTVTLDSLAVQYEKLRGTLSVDSHRNALKQVKTLLRFCVAKKWIHKLDLDEVKGKGSRSPGKDQLLIDESRTFYNHCLRRAGEGDMGAVAALLCHLSLRSVKEALGISARAIDDGGRVLQVLRSKTKRGVRGVPVPKDMQPILLKLKAGKGPEDLIFTGRRDRKWVWDQVERLCAEAGVPRVCPHALRGGLATNLSVHGVPHEVIQAIMGHEPGSKVTRDAYIEPTQAGDAEVERRFTVLRGGK